MMDIRARNNNRDGAPLRYVAEQLVARPEQVKILILVSDGQPADYGYMGTAAEEDLRGIRKEYQRKGVLFVAAAIGDDKQNIERIYGDSFMDITDLQQLPVKLTSVVKRHIRVWNSKQNQLGQSSFIGCPDNLQKENYYETKLWTGRHA